MKINIHNYEEFALDYLEGNLGEPALSEFSNFLLKHPDIRMELEDLETTCISEEDLEPTPLFSKKEELYKEAAVVNLLKSSVYVKLWQIAAAFILLLSSIWVINSYYLGEGIDKTPIVLAEKIAPKVETVKEIQEEINENIPPSDSELIAANEQEKEATQRITAKPESEVYQPSSVKKRTQRESEVEIARDAEIEFIQNLTENEFLLDPYFEEDQYHTPKDIAFLPVNQMMLEMPSEPLDVATQNLLWNPVYVEAIEDELYVRRFLAKLAERMLPDQMAAAINNVDLNINTEKIPQELLPRFLQQSN